MKYISSTAKALYKEPYRYIKTLTTKTESISFEIKYEDYQRLMYWRSLAIQNYSLNMVDHDYVNAIMTYKDKIIPVKVRLRGGTAHEHQAGEKWSFRVKIKGNNRLFGMKEFSLMSPERRNYLMEWLLRMVIKKEGIISKKYGFLNITINGTSKGIYAFDEHFSKEMIENNQRRNGPIIRFSDDSFWLEKAAFKQHPDEWGDYYFSAYIDEIESKNYNNSNPESELFQEAADLINAFRRGDLPTSKVFDVDKLAKSMAIGDLLGGWHGFVVFNNKFYYNPIIRKLEPIPDDSFTEFGKLNKGIFRLNDKYITGAFLKQIFDDLKFTERYLSELQRVTNEEYFDSILINLNDQINQNINVIRIDYPWYDFPKDEIYINQKLLKETLNPNRAILASFNKQFPNSISLNIATTKTLPVELINVTYDNEIILQPRSSFIVKGRDYLGYLKYHEYEFIFPEGLDNIINIKSLKVNYRILGTNNIRTEPILNYKAYDLNRLKRNPKLMEPNYKKFKFLEIDSLAKTITIKSGAWKLIDNLIIPEDYTFICGSATSVDLQNSSVIISYSPLLFIGTSDQPINLTSSDSTGKGIAVFSNGRKSKLDNVIIDNLNMSSNNIWNMTGAVTFYKSPVTIQNCRFTNINAEDALNLINTEFHVENTIFENSFSDAIDIDFCDGSITNTRFISSGNDAVDISGSKVTISKLFITDSNDKGISVGENSEVSIKETKVSNSTIGIAVKDESYSKITRVEIDKCEYGIVGYQKKPEFGPSNIIANSINMEDVKFKYLIEEGSSLTVDDDKIEAINKNVYQYLYK